MQRCAAAKNRAHLQVSVQLHILVEGGRHFFQHFLATVCASAFLLQHGELFTCALRKQEIRFRVLTTKKMSCFTENPKRLLERRTSRLSSDEFLRIADLESRA